MNSVSAPLIARVNGTDVTVGSVVFSPDADPEPEYNSEALKLAERTALEPLAGQEGWTFRWPPSRS